MFVFLNMSFCHCLGHWILREVLWDLSKYIRCLCWILVRHIRSSVGMQLSVVSLLNIFVATFNIQRSSDPAQACGHAIPCCRGPHFKVEWVAFELHFWGLPRTSLGPNTSYSARYYSWLSSVIQGKFLDSTSIQMATVSFPIRSSAWFTTHHTIHRHLFCQLVTSLQDLNKYDKILSYTRRIDST